MPNYTRTGPFNNGGAPGISSAFLNNVENQLSAVQYGTNFIFPYTLVNNISMTNGTTNTYTCTGIGPIPAGATGVYIAYAYQANAQNTAILLTPHGTAWANGNYPASTPEQSSAGIGVWGSAVVPLDGSGKMDVKVVNANITNLFINIYGYIY